MSLAEYQKHWGKEDISRVRKKQNAERAGVSRIRTLS